MMSSKKKMAQQTMNYDKLKQVVDRKDRQDMPIKSKI